MRLSKKAKTKITKDLIKHFQSYKTEGDYSFGICRCLCSFLPSETFIRYDFVLVLKKFAVENKYLKNEHRAYWFPRSNYGCNKRIKLLKAYLNFLEKK